MPPSYPDITAGILVGGRGTRLGGRDKASLQTSDQKTTLVQRLVQAVAPFVARVALLGRAEQDYPALDVPLWPDEVTDRGPLGGLATLLRGSQTPWCLLVACDMPHWDATVLHALACARQTDLGAIVPRTQRGLEPTSALYHTNLRARVETALSGGDWSLHSLIAGTDHVEVLTAEDLLINVNTQADLAALERVN